MQRKLESFEQRDRFVPGLLQNAHVELELGQLSIDVVVGKFEIQRVHGDYFQRRTP